MFSSWPAALLILHLDREGLSDTIRNADLSIVANADAAQQVVTSAVAINAAFLTLYFSLTLLVLTVASSNLGVRLVDRWLDKGLVRVSLAGLAFTLLFSLGALGAVDADAPFEELPLGLVTTTVFLQGVNVAMLTIALHDLGRTIFVDRSIANLGEDAKAGPVSVEARDPADLDWAQRVCSPREGYVEGNNLDRLAKHLDGRGGIVRVCAAPGQHVLEGETLLLLEQDVSGSVDEGKLLGCVPVGDFRSDGQGAVFRIRLLVEIAARALSPAVNDFYTALTAADRLGAAVLGQRKNWVDQGQVAAYRNGTLFELPGQDFRGLFEDPLNAFRQAGCQYPSVSIRMINNYARIRDIVLDDGQSDQFAEFLEKLARELRDHAMSVTDYDGDRKDIADAFTEGFEKDETHTRGTP
ncbi:hypothetical protein BMF35_b0118 [Aurantiacibacter gangjinensis]|uniref:Uncharacterized protein n=1 Tax=Aurantiacibacter gangjinensis TaxID=502682 RepID=A0A0G9MJY2_9SPHN|nr:hypothetical protein BMF35_b0118 [Aurantiacibacter gangjinensis]KLE31051.1 hypothetical protein AAW01_12410 [Aurantiacibacter gangjinensis]